MKRKRHGCSNHFKFKISLEWCCFPLIKRYADLWYIPWSIQVHQLSVCPSKLHQHLRPGLWMAPMHVVLHKCPLLSQPPEILRRFSVSSFSWCPKDVLRASRFSHGCADWIGIRRTWYGLIMLDPICLATVTLYQYTILPGQDLQTLQRPVTFHNSLQAKAFKTGQNSPIFHDDSE